MKSGKEVHSKGFIRRRSMVYYRYQNINRNRQEA